MLRAVPLWCSVVLRKNPQGIGVFSSNVRDGSKVKYGTQGVKLLV